jgi:FlaA1/EpsC-like NDP-sugar epimerase
VGDNIVGTDHAKIMRANEDCLDVDTLNSYLLDIQTAICIMDHSKVRSILEQAITGYRPHDTVADHLVHELLSKEPTKESMQNNIVKLR